MLLYCDDDDDDDDGVTLLYILTWTLWYNKIVIFVLIVYMLTCSLRVQSVLYLYLLIIENIISFFKDIYF